MTRGGFFGYTLPAQIATSLVTPHVISYYDRYDTFIGNNTRTYEAITAGSETYWIETVRTFKHNGLIEDVNVTTNGNEQVQFAYTYDNLNRLTQVEYGDIVESYNYNLRGWSTGKTVTADGERLFSMSARYESPANPESLPQFGGNISEWQWGRGNLADKIYSFAYDALSRIISGTLIGNVAGNDTFAEKDITYDRNGNILTLKRFGENGIIADIVNILTGNRIASNTYDDCGNVTYD